MGESVSQMGRRLFAQMEQFHRFACRPEMSLNLSAGEMLIMSQVERARKREPEKEGVKPSELTGGGFVSKSAVSRILGTLEERGYLMRTVSKSDRRVIDVTLTEAGKACLDEEKRHRDQMADRVFMRMGEKKMRQFLELSEELVSYAKEELKKTKKQEK